jgi:hypothetical protein
VRARPFVAALLAAALLLPAHRAPGREPLRLTVVFTGDVSGYLDPCG